MADKCYMCNEPRTICSGPHTFGCQERQIDTLRRQLAEERKENVRPDWSNGVRCDCGAWCLDDCPVCGAPQCCPRCCRITTLEAENKRLQEENALLRAAISTPEVCAGVVSEVVERERDAYAMENKRLRGSIEDAYREGWGSAAAHCDEELHGCAEDWKESCACKATRAALSTEGGKG